MFAGAPGVLVRLKVVDKPPTVALTIYAPALLFAVNVPLATPEALVAIWIVLVELEKVPLGTVLPAGAVKVTLELGMTTLPASFTVTDRAVVNAVSMVADWLFPALAVTLAGT